MKIIPAIDVMEEKLSGSIGGIPAKKPSIVIIR